MTDEELKQASLALLNWLESQDITVADSVSVMALTISGCVRQLAIEGGLDPNKGANAVARMIKRTIADA